MKKFFIFIFFWNINLSYANENLTLDSSTSARPNLFLTNSNTDAEAPFFKAADYGIVGDAFEVLPRLNEALKNFKG